MSIFKELNDVQLDLSEFEEMPLSKYDQRRIVKNVKKKIHPKARNKKWMGVVGAVVAACILSITLTIDKGIIANMPFTAEPIEKYITHHENFDFTSYKTAIGESSENARGKLTLNEVMIDDRRILFGATFEPAAGVNFDYQTYIQPTVKVNGREMTFTTGGQSIELNDSMFTIYNDVDLSEVITSEDVNIEISYDTWRYHLDDAEVIEQPWTFNVQVSQKNLLAEKKVFEMNETIELFNGQLVTVKEVVSTPISTTVYYDLSKSNSESIVLDIQAENGLESAYGEYSMTSSRSNELGYVSVIRFDGLTLEEGKYFLIARNIEDEIISKPIPIQ